MGVLWSWRIFSLDAPLSRCRNYLKGMNVRAFCPIHNLGLKRMAGVFLFQILIKITPLFFFRTGQGGRGILGAKNSLIGGNFRGFRSGNEGFIYVKGLGSME